MQVLALLGSHRLIGIHQLIGKIPNNNEYATVTDVFCLASLLHFNHKTHWIALISCSEVSPSPDILLVYISESDSEQSVSIRSILLGPGHINRHYDLLICCYLIFGFCLVILCLTKLIGGTNLHINLARPNSKNSVSVAL